MLGTGEPTRWVGNTELDWFMTNSPLLFGNPIPLKEFHISDHIAISIVLYCIVLCCIVLCCVVLCCVVLYCVVLCCVVLCCVVLCGVVLYCIVLYFIVCMCIYVHMHN